ncbi:MULTISPECIES: FeoA family protein [Desulfofundulus]|uniref:Ferrous iron transport protein A n=2 Tax=Desulfofundulus TaxID=2282741 RepID=A0A6N7IQS4_9FIRM|nr:MULTISPECIES: FeoA family protein [Desulfofundulus]MCL6561164.1 ferrous iron transport protein A [Bacillota bacterium]MQL51899.1 ferrous iron transport protein A [Desulfofundulus thermobenzoicus]SHJ49847.1 ferrous iron transport protein A [Desulfofundulus thermosubterraneus DSM 16057]
MKPLGFMAQGESGVVRDVAGGVALREKLTALGLVRGKVIRMVQNNGIGPVIVALGEGRLALGRGMVQRIFVDEITG